MLIISFSTAVLIDFKVKFLQAESQAALPTLSSAAIGSVAHSLGSLHHAAAPPYSVPRRHDEKAAEMHSPGILTKQVTKTSAGKHGMQTLAFSCNPWMLPEVEDCREERRGARARASATGL